MNKILEHVGLMGILPVAIVEDETKAVQLGQALCEGGLRTIEVTFRTSAAAHVIERIAASSLDMLIGAGTVLTIDQARTAIEAGARFIVSPGFNPKVVEYCIANSVPVIPGVMTNLPAVWNISKRLQRPLKKCDSSLPVESMNRHYSRTFGFRRFSLAVEAG